MTSNGKRLQGKKIVALLAHPDDETFIFGGTIAHYAKQGASVKVVSATKGEMGRRMGNPPSITRESMPAVREQELRDACRFLGAGEPVFLGLRDKTVEYADYDVLVNRLCSIVREDQPDVVMTFHPVFGGHPDHCAIGKASVDAVAAASDPKYRTAAAEPCPPPALYYISFGDSMKQPERYGFTASDIVRIDVSDSLEEKMRAFRAHRCQTEMDEWLWQPDPVTIQKFGKHEYFVIGDHKPRARRDDLFGF